MIRCRFYSSYEENGRDYRPVKFPPPHPFWCSGENHQAFILVGYADSEDQILEYWPEAENIESESAEEYAFTSRFPCPDWFDNTK